MLGLKQAWGNYSLASDGILALPGMRRPFSELVFIQLHCWIWYYRCIELTGMVTPSDLERRRTKCIVSVGTFRQ